VGGRGPTGVRRVLAGAELHHVGQAQGNAPLQQELVPRQGGAAHPADTPVPAGAPVPAGVRNAVLAAPGE